MIQVQQEVQHWQHGVGTVVAIVNDDCLSVQFEDRIRQCSGDNLTDLSNQPLIKHDVLVSQPTIDAVQLCIKKRRAALAVMRAEVQDGLKECTREELVARLMNSGDYKLTLDADGDGVELAQDEYIAWTGESFPEDRIHLESNRPQPRRWRFEFIHQPGFTYSFPVIVSQEVRYARLQTGARGFYRDGKIIMHYAEEVEKLVRLGLRAK